MVCLPTITAPTGSWARRSETSRAYVRPTHSATVRSDERVRPPRRAPGRSSTYPRRHRVVVCVQSPGIHEIRFETPATPAKAPRAFAAFRLATIYLPQFLLLKWVVVKYSGVPLPVGLLHIFCHFPTVGTVGNWRKIRTRVPHLVGRYVRGDGRETCGDAACSFRESGGDEGENAMHGDVCAADPSLDFFFFLLVR